MVDRINWSGSVRTDVDVDVQIDIDELEDDELAACVEEAKKRGLIGKDGKKLAPISERVKDVMDALMCRREDSALDLFVSALTDDFDSKDDLLEVYRCLKMHEHSAALCALDKVITA